MNDSWIKLYRKTANNGIMKDHKAWVLFSWILINVDRKTGRMKLGRYKVADALDINPNSYYKILKRLEMKWKLVEVTVTKEWSEVYIVNWAKYQHQENDDDNAVTTIRQRATDERNTIQEVQEYKNTNNIDSAVTSSIEYLRHLPEAHIVEFTTTYKANPTMVKEKAEGLLNYCAAHNKKYKNYRALLQGSMLRDFGKRRAEAPFNPAEVAPEIPEEVRLANLKRSEEMRANFKFKTI